MLPKFANLSIVKAELGSMGKAGDSETAGGGRIVLIAESLIMSG